MLDQRLAAGDGFGIAVDAQHAAIGGFQNGAGIAAAAESAVDIVRAIAGRRAPPALPSASREDVRSCAHRLSRRGRVPAAPSSAPTLRPRSAHSVSASQIWNFCDLPTKAMRSFRPACSIMRVGQDARGPDRRRPATGCARSPRWLRRHGWARKTDPARQAAHAARRAASGRKLPARVRQSWGRYRRPAVFWAARIWR